MGNKTIRIQGIQAQTEHCAPISVEKFQEMLNLGSVMQVFQLQHLPPDKLVEVPLQFRPLLSEFQDIFAEPTGLPPKRACDHRIPLLPNSKPVYIRPYRHNPAQKDEIERQVKEMLASGVIRPSSSAYSSPALLVKKKDGTWRVCIDYRQPNAITVKGKFPMPVIDELLDELSRAQVFSKLDLRAGYHQIRLQEGEEHKTAFQTHTGHCEYMVMSFGLTGAPATFQGAMNDTLAPVLRKFALVFFDDILVYSQDMQSHLTHLKEVFLLLHKHQWKVKLSKCSFGQSQLSYLGHIISGKGVATDQSKIEEVVNWKVPDIVKKLRGFLGLAGYYRKFVKNFRVISKPLTQLLRKDVPFVRSSEANQAFQSLKVALVTAPVLALPDFSKTFTIETDASDGGIGAVLCQEGHPIAYVSKALGIKNRGLSTYEKEYLAILLAVDHWRSYLQHAEFIILTYHHSLMHLNEQRLHTPWQHKAYTKLRGLQFKICYRKGSSNAAADALSRKYNLDPVDLMAVSSCVPVWLQEVAAGYLLDEQTKQLLAELSLSVNSKPPFSLHNSIIKYKGRIWIGYNTELQHRIISTLHDSPMGGHSGFPVTYRRIKSLFAWPKMKQTVQRALKGCGVCLQVKPNRSKYPGLLQPLPVPDGAWQVITMDFIEGLPKSSRFNCIMVVVDKFSKYSHFVPLAHTFTALEVADLLCTTFTNSMAFLITLSLIGTKSSQVICGNSCLLGLELSCT